MIFVVERCFHPSRESRFDGPAHNASVSNIATTKDHSLLSCVLDIQERILKV
jgi:hypothetical protein